MVTCYSLAFYYTFSPILFKEKPLLFYNNLGLIDTKLDVHCIMGDKYMCACNTGFSRRGGNNWRIEKEGKMSPENWMVRKGRWVNPGLIFSFLD